MTTRTIPADWRVPADQCEYLGSDDDGYDYWCITSPTIAKGIVGREVFRVRNGGSRWLCSYAARPAYCRCVNITTDR